VVTPYEVLEVHPRASEAVIRAAYRTLVQRCHPDRSPGEAAAARMSLINRAYELLSDPARRARYDSQSGLAGTERRGSGRVLPPARQVAAAAAMRPFVFRRFA
jgi:curved DNA-binding protein CbpA